jgi:hypothetical protein
MADDDKSKVIPFAWRGAITSADLGEPSDLTKVPAQQLIDAIEAQGFEGEAGPLENSTQWIEIKRRLK